MNAHEDRSRVLLDAGAMAPLLHRVLPEAAGTRCVGARLHQSRRRISRKTEQSLAPYLDAAYELDVLGAGGPRTLWCSLRGCSGGLAAVLAREGAGLHLPALDAAVWPLQADPALPQLAPFLHAPQVQALLSPTDAEAPGSRMRVVRYEPRSHVVARFELTLQGRHQALWAKAHAGPTWREVARRLMVLWPCGQAQPEAFALARPLASSAAFGAVWQAEVSGTPLRQLLAGEQAAPWLTRTAVALAHLQALPLLGRERLHPADLLARATKQARKLERADPALQGALAPLLALLAQQLPPTERLVNAHGDFHADQLLVAEERVHLFDLDTMALAHPAHDIADFASQLLTDEALPAPQRTLHAAAWVDAAVRAARGAVPARCLDWHLRLLLLRKAYSFFVRHRAHWPQRVRQALSLAALGLEALAAPAADSGTAPTRGARA